MIIEVVTSAKMLAKSADLYRKILSAVSAEGDTLAREGVNGETGQSKQYMDEDITEAIDKADVVICPVVNGSAFEMGFYVAVALQKKKPTLLLMKKDSTFSYADPLIMCKVFNDNNLEQTIQTFLADNRIKAKDLRFNFVLDRKLYGHLRLRSHKSGKTKAEFVRDLLMKDMQGN